MDVEALQSDILNFDTLCASEDEVKDVLSRAYNALDELKRNQVTSEFDELTGYCLCGCCDHGI